ncbi:MAG TPA: hypothetical protein VE995_02260, partial [Gaiellaceae bacterium]|nr:hypothetical protein [Gaiellaceae bacterium]
MTETNTSEPGATAPSIKRNGAPPFPLAPARRGLVVGGVALVVLNAVLAMSGGVAPWVPALLWGAAAACFLASFVVHLMQPAPPAEARRAASEPAGDVTTKVDGAAANEPPASEPKSAPLLRKGNPLRLVRGGATALLGSLFALLLMAHAGQLRWGVPLGAVFVVIASWGVMDLLGTFDDADDRVAASTTLRALSRPLGAFVAAAVLFCAALGFAAAGRAIPQAAWGVVVTLSFVAGVAAFFDVGRALGVWKVDEEGLERPLWKRHGFWLVVLAAALYFPAMGTYSLWDPWETHYGEVSREILARDDWISLWWAQDGWFWSKPVADMWMQAIAMATLGVHYRPDKMLIGDGTQPHY